MKIKVWRKIVVYFYPRPPRGGRQIFLEDNPWNGEFLSTPSARRATHPVTPDLSRAKKFRSTPSARRATPDPSGTNRKAPDFYPRPPRGGRRCNPCIDSPRLRFLSTPSARRATRCRPRNSTPEVFLSTPSARRATPVRASRPFSVWYFYPRPPRGGRHALADKEV